MRWRNLLLCALFVPLAANPALAQPDLNEKIQKAMKEASKRVAPSVVQITTLGGTDMVVTSPKGPIFRKSLGPTTGVVVESDGYVISSAFNFINNPSNILVGVPGTPEPYVARKIATDRSRMLTLLKIEAKGLPVPEWVAKKDIYVGQWAMALGRSLDAKRENPPAISAGIISALDRIWGKAVQVDAKVSPINYGGPVVDIKGRVQGILIPASPNSEEVVAGFEWYDSGIGFSIPMEDVLAMLPRLKKGEDLKKGLLGVAMKSPDKYSAIPEVGTVTKDSAAARAGIKAGDVIVEIDATPVVNMAQVLHKLGTKYEGDKINLKYKRGDKIVAIENLELVGQLSLVTHAFLGMLPIRDDPKLGVEVRYVYAGSPADKAGLKEADRIVKIGGGERMLSGFAGQKAGRLELFDFLNSVTPGAEIQLEVMRGGKAQTLKATLAQLPDTTQGKDDALPKKVPERSTIKKALDALEVANAKEAKIDKKELPKAETGIIKRTTAAGDHQYQIYVHPKYDPNVAHAMVVWLHPPGKSKDEDFKRVFGIWEDYCEENHIIMVCPVSKNEDGWTPSEADPVLASINEVAARYTIDRQRIVAHGMAVGGQMAIYLGFNHRDLIRGVATTGSVVTTVKDNVANQRLSFFLAAGGLDPIIKSVGESKIKLQQKRFPAYYHEMPARGREELDNAALETLVAWIECLDRQ